MILADISIRRPVFAVMMAGALLVLGVTSYLALSVDLFPKMDLPYVVVTVVYPGAGAEAVELDVTKKIEDAVNTIAGVKHISSTAQEGYSLTVIEFSIETDPLNDAAEVRDKVNSIRGDLPTDIEEPVVQRYDPQSEPIMSISISGRQSLRDLTDYVDDVIQPRLESVPGVGQAEIIGGAEREIQVRVNPERLKALDLTPLMVAARLQAANLEVPGGRVIDGNREWVVRTMGRFVSVQQIRDLVVLSPKGHMVRLDEIAEIIDTEVESTSASRLNGEPAVGLDIRRQSGANTVDVAEGVNEVLEKIKTELPAGMSLVIATDNSEFIRGAIEDVLINIIWGGLLAILVILLFLANWRSTVISAVAIPISIIATFTLMRTLDFTLNMITLMGMALAVGLLIDDAIVVIENIYRHMEMGKPPLKAAHEATDEIGLAVSATTLAIIVVFLPVAFMSGIIGRIFNSFGLTVAFAVAVSLFIAFTLTPMLSSRFFRPHEEQIESRLHRGLKWWDRGFRHIEHHWYRPALRWCLAHRPATVGLATLILLASLMLIPVIGTEFLPQYDQGFVFITFEGQAGDKLTTTIGNIQTVEKLLMANPAVASVLTTIGGGTDPVYSGTITVKLKDRAEREVTAMELTKIFREEMRSIPGYFFTAEIEQGHAGTRPISLSIRGPELPQLELYTKNLSDRLVHVPGVADLKSSQETGKPELRVTIDRDRAADLGVNIAEAAQTLQIFIDGKKVTRFKEGDKEFDIRLQIAEPYRQDQAYLAMLPIPSNKEIAGRDRFVVPLGQIAAIERTSGPSQITRYDRVREIRLSASAVDRAAGSVRSDVQAVVDSMMLATGYSIAAVGEAEIQAESFSNIFTALILAVIFIYLVLASQYNSFLDPLAIMVSLPLAVVGALVGLLMFGSAFSIVSLIGIILLMGLVSKNGILLIDFTKQRRAQGMERNAALEEAGPVRFRPIIMTSLATIFGALPLALGIGSGGEMRAPISRAVIGGMISSTVLTLLVIPVVYTYLDDLARGDFRAFFGRKPKPSDEKSV